MACNCGKKKVATQPKKIIKTPQQNTTNNQNVKRIIRRAAR